MDGSGSLSTSGFGSNAGSAAGTSPGGMSGGEASGPPAGEASGTAIKRRAPIACRRCRRMRSKCVHDKARPPCKSCGEAGIPAEECIFPTRGQPDHDRDYRHPRTRADKKPGASKARRPGPTSGLVGPSSTADPWLHLPPLFDLVDGVNRFTKYYFQLGFIPKQQYPERLLRDHRSANVFLLLSILSISARLSPALRVRFGTGVKASEFFMERASELTLAEVYSEPTLEKCQAFYLLSIAQQGSGMRNKSYINMGIATRMATLMMLHREETYQIQSTNPDMIMRAESARRTLWMLHSQDSLHSGPLSPVSLGASDITALLPCDEEDFAAGREPKSRAALEGTQPAVDNPELITDRNRSLFASLMQIHHLWGIVGRRAVAYGRTPRPWEPTSQFSQMVRRLRDWENSLPSDHLFSTQLLKSYKSKGQDLAYLCVTMMTRLCNMVLRRPYLVDIIKRDVKNPQNHSFFNTLSSDLFRNVRELYEQVDAQFTDRSPDESVGAQIAAFCVYSCGLFATYLCKYPNVCPDASITRNGPMMLQRTVTILNECKQVWPLAARWAESLEKFSRDPSSLSIGHEGSMDDGKDPIPRAIRQLPPISKSAASAAAAATMPDRVLPLPGTQPASSPSTAMSSPRPSSFHVSNSNSNTTPTNQQPSPSGIYNQHQNQHYTHQPSHSPPQHQQQHHPPPPVQYNHFAPPPQHLQPQYSQAAHSHSHSHSPPQFTHQTHMQQNVQQPLRSVNDPSTAAAAAAAAATQSNMYLSSPPSSMPTIHRQPDGVGMLIEAFDTQQQAPAPPPQHPQGPGQYPGSVPVVAANPAFYANLGTINDGFEGELQFYIDGAFAPNNTAAMGPDGWLLGTPGFS